MKTARFRSLFLYLILGGFLAGLIFFVACFLIQGGSWAMRPANQHLSGQTQLSYAGDITDRDGEVIATSVDGQRVYHNDYLTRCSLLHVVGDTNGYISTGIQSVYLSSLTGFNPVMGVTAVNNGGGGIQLTVDSDLNRLALEGLGYRNGAVVLYNYKTGEMLCNVSAPYFDPSNVPGDIDTNPEYDGAYLNKALSGTFTPGSIFKVVTTACALENISDIDSRTFQCSGKITVNGNVIVCDSNTAHGSQDLQDALTNSCNVAFAQLAVELGHSKMMATANEMGFNRSFSVDDNKTVASTYQVSGSTGDEGLAWSGIGQFTDTANPVHMMLLMGAIANEGTPVMPYTVEGNSLFGGGTSTGSPLMSKSTANTLKTMMRNNVINGYGDSMFPGMEVCAKTGTAEVEGEEATGWIVGFSQNPDTPYAFAVVVEEGGYGRTSAGYIASALMDAVCSGNY